MSTPLAYFETIVRAEDVEVFEGALSRFLGRLNRGASLVTVLRKVPHGEHSRRIIETEDEQGLKAFIADFGRLSLDTPALEPGGL